MSVSYFGFALEGHVLLNCVDSEYKGTRKTGNYFSFRQFSGTGTVLVVMAASSCTHIPGYSLHALLHDNMPKQHKQHSNIYIYIYIYIYIIYIYIYYINEKHFVRKTEYTLQNLKFLTLSILLLIVPNKTITMLMIQCQKSGVLT